MPGKRWTKQEVSYLKANAQKICARKLAQHLGRTMGAVHSKVQELGLLDIPKSPFTPEMDKVLIDLGAREASRVLLIDFKKAEARRKYLKRKGRIPEGIQIQKAKPIDDGRFVHRWVFDSTWKRPSISAPRSVFELGARHV